MADHPLEPEELTPAGLPTARRGYDRKAVSALLDEAARRWGELRDRYDSLMGEVGRRGGVENLGRDLREIGDRVAVILGEAQAAAEDLRSQAIEEATNTVGVADATAGAMIDEAGEVAFGLRKDAWETGSHLLAEVQATIDAMIETADADTLIIRANAEQAAHRHLSEARKEVSDITRAARFDAERLVGEAKRKADELLAHAIEAGVASAPPEDPAPAWGVKVIGSEAAARGGDPAVEIDPHHPAYGDVLAAEVSSLRQSVPQSVASPEPEPPATPDPEPAPETTPEPEPEADPEPETAHEPEAVPPTDESPDDVGGLFDRLRRTDEIPIVPSQPVPSPVPEPEPESEPEPEPEPVPAPARGPDAIEVRDRVLLPVLNEYVREARRTLMDIQNVALDEIRTLRKGVAWEPDPELIGDALAAVVLPLAAASVEAGGKGAAALGAAPSPEPVAAERAEGLIEQMSDALVAAAVEFAAAEDPGAEVGRMFRTWRNDEVERWVRTAGYAGYHDGLVAGLASAGVSEIVGVRHGRLCSECPATAGVVWSPANVPPEGYESPPAHLDCTCAVEPHS
jgi:cell division septum initiation protein DivIVA